MVHPATTMCAHVYTVCVLSPCSPQKRSAPEENGKEEREKVDTTALEVRKRSITECCVPPPPSLPSSFLPLLPLLLSSQVEDGPKEPKRLKQESGGENGDSGDTGGSGEEVTHEPDQNGKLLRESTTKPKEKKMETEVSLLHVMMCS